MLVARDARELLRKHARVAAGIAETADRARDLAAQGLERRLQPSERRGVEDLLLLTMLGQQRHFLHTRLELRGITMQVQRTFRDCVVLDAFRLHHIPHYRLAVLAETELDQRVALCALGRALAQ